MPGCGGPLIVGCGGMPDGIDCGGKPGLGGIPEGLGGIPLGLGGIPLGLGGIPDCCGGCNEAPTELGGSGPPGLGGKGPPAIGGILLGAGACGKGDGALDGGILFVGGFI